jgi:hypothetical protein
MFKLMVNITMAGIVFVLTAFIAHADVILIDFGNNSTFRGASQTGPDNNGNYWNSVWSGSFYSGLVDINNDATTVNFGFSSATGTDSYNGPAGSTSDPLAPGDIGNTVIDAPALGNLGGSLSAAFDYYVTSTFEIQGLSLSQTYNLTFFGSHKFNADNTTRYTIYDNNGFTNAVTFADLVVGVGSAHNSNTVVTISGLSPQPNGVIYVGFKAANGVNNGYLNAMQIEIVPESAAVSLMLVAGAALGLSRRRRFR